MSFVIFKSEGICKDDDLKKPVQDWVKHLNEQYAAVDTEPVKVGNIICSHCTFTMYIDYIKIIMLY